MYLCDVTSCFFDQMSVSFLWNKENKQDFLQGEKKKEFSFLFSSLYSYFLFSYVPLSFLSWKILLFSLNRFSVFL